MNKGLLALNIILLVAVGVLFFLFFGKKENGNGNKRISFTGDTILKPQLIPVAYFDMDSVEANFTLFKQMQSEVLRRENGINDTISRMKQSFQSYYMKVQNQAGNLSPRERDSIGNQLAQMDVDIKNKEAELGRNYQAYYMSKQQEIVTLIKNYCKEFNKDNKYSYIIAREPGLFYYTDTAYNITSELLKGLNAYYVKKKS
jgi:outer membrane protein